MSRRVWLHAERPCVFCPERQVGEGRYRPSPTCCLLLQSSWRLDHGAGRAPSRGPAVTVGPCLVKDALGPPVIIVDRNQRAALTNPTVVVFGLLAVEA